MKPLNFNITCISTITLTVHRLFFFHQLNETNFAYLLYDFDCVLFGIFIFGWFQLCMPTLIYNLIMIYINKKNDQADT